MGVLKRVDLSTDVYFVCLNQALCTEGEEVVGLLVGQMNDGIAYVCAVIILRRSDKRKDRVEISPEQLSQASTEAEKLSTILKMEVRVIGWYHSHPRLTVYPSLVDVCTQESYQFMDQGFIGIIFSVYNQDPNKLGGRIQMICYQSKTAYVNCNVEKAHFEVPIQLVPSSNISNVCMNSVIQLPRFLWQEEQIAYQMANQVPMDYLTRLHNSSIYLRKMGQIAEVISGPLLKMLEERILNNEMKRKRLQEKKKTLSALIDVARVQKAQKEEEKAKIAELKLIEAKEKEHELEPQDTELNSEQPEIISLEEQEMNIQVHTVHGQSSETVIEEMEVEISSEQDLQSDNPFSELTKNLLAEKKVTSDSKQSKIVVESLKVYVPGKQIEHGTETVVPGTSASKLLPGPTSVQISVQDSKISLPKDKEGASKIIHVKAADTAKVRKDATSKEKVILKEVKSKEFPRVLLEQEKAPVTKESEIQIPSTSAQSTSSSTPIVAKAPPKSPK